MKAEAANSYTFDFRLEVGEMAEMVGVTAENKPQMDTDEHSGLNFIVCGLPDHRGDSLETNRRGG